MKIFGFTFGASKKLQIQETPKPANLPFAFSTPFMNISGGNLSMPQVSTYYKQNNIVLFGTDNLYPQMLNQMYYTSPLHGSIIEFITNSVSGGSYEWNDNKLSAQDKIDLLSFEKYNKLKKLVRLLTRDYIIHRRICVKIIKKSSKIIKFVRLDPSTIRNSIDLKTFVYSPDWSRGQYQVEKYDRYSEDTNKEETIYVYQDNTPGQDIYPIPSYNSILNWCYLDGETSYFHKNNIQNGVFPSIVIRRPKEFASVEDIVKFKEEISSKTGASNAGRLLLLTGNGFDDVPEVTSLSANDNDKLFESTSKEIKDQICFGWSINPNIVGIKVAGSLGNSEELKTSYAIFEKNVVLPLRETIEEVINDLLSIANVNNSIKFNNFQIVDGEIIKK